jgi:hypothetical protein
MQASQVKAYFRRGQAQKSDELKLRDFTLCLELDPENQAAKAEVQNLKTKEARRVAEEKKAYAKMFL